MRTKYLFENLKKRYYLEDENEDKNIQTFLNK
jgi:hypothetical protein